MLSRFGPFLRQLRLSSGFSQAYVAQQAGVGRVTLNRWESGKQQPRLMEMEGVLKALGATATQVRQAAQLLGTAEGRRHETQKEDLTGELTGIGSRPNGGDLLQALRLRSGLSQEEAALQVGVTTRTLRRWEKAETWPDDSQLHTLCYVLGAHPQEVLALSQGSSKLDMAVPDQALTRDEWYEKIDQIYYSNAPYLEPLKDLQLLQIEAQVWSPASQSTQGRDLLAQIYSYHANRCSTYERWNEGAMLVKTWSWPAAPVKP